MTTPLTPAEERVLREKAKGIPAKGIAGLLGISEQTVKNHVTSILTKLDAANTIEAMVARGWVVIPGEPVIERARCRWVGQCGRPIGHRGHHGGFREVER